MSEYYGDGVIGLTLAHSGRIGQKWGVRNYQDYITKPTRSGMIGKYYGPDVDHDGERKSRAEIKAEKKKQKTREKSLKKARKTRAKNKKAAEIQKRRAEAQFDAAEKAEKQRQLAEAKREAKLEPKRRGLEYRKKDLKNLSDEELQKRIARLELEKRYKDLNQQTMHEGKRIAQDILKETGKKVAINVGVKAGEYAVKQIVAKTAGQDVADEIFGKSKIADTAKKSMMQISNERRKQRVDEENESRRLAQTEAKQRLDKTYTYDDKGKESSAKDEVNKAIKDNNKDVEELIRRILEEEKKK